MIALLVLAAFALIPAHAGRAETREALNRSLRQEAFEGAIPLMERTIRAGADVNSRALHGETALDYAIRGGRHQAAIRLVELGADPDLADDSGISPLYRAAGDCNASRVVEALLKAGANVNQRDLYGRSALMNAAHANCVRTVAVLLLRGRNVIDVDAQDDEMQTAESLAREGFVPQMLEMTRRYQHEGRIETLAPVRRVL